MVNPLEQNERTENMPQDAEVQDAKFFAAVGYINILCFVPLFLKKDNKFAQFHGKQALVLFILEIAASILKAGLESPRPLFGHRFQWLQGSMV